MTFGRQLLRHIFKCVSAEKGKRILYAVVNIVFIALAVLSGWGFVKALDIMFGQTFVGGLILLIVCGAFAVGFLINGVICQLIHTVVNLIAIFTSEERNYAIWAFIIALLSIVAMVTAIVLLV